MNKRMRLKMEFAKKTYDKLPDVQELKDKVKELEAIISQPSTIWDDEESEMYRKVNSLSLSDKRLLIVYSIVGTVNRTAKLYQVDRSTVSNHINRIKQTLLND